MTNYATTIMFEEGVKNTLYKCSEGKWTIGVGRNLEDRGLSEDEVMFLYKTDEAIALDIVNKYIDKFEWLSDGRKVALVSLAFQLGEPRFKLFEKMVAAVNESNFALAANEMLDSKWRRQTPNRANRAAEMMRTGKIVNPELKD